MDKRVLQGQKSMGSARAGVCGGRNSLSVGGKIRADARARAYARGYPTHESGDGWRVNASQTAEYAQGGSSGKNRGTLSSLKMPCQSIIKLA